MLAKLLKLNLTKYVLFVSACLVFCFLLPASLHAYTSPGKPTGFVNDFAHILTADQISTLSNTLTQYKTTSGNEVAVVIIKDLEGDTIENYANLLFREWGIGSHETNNGALLLVSIVDRKMRIEVGYGLEGSLTDLQTYRIETDSIAPYFKEQKYFVGIQAGVDKIIGTISGSDPVSTEVPKANTSLFLQKGFLQFAFFVFVIGFQFIFSILASTKSWWLGGVMGGVVGIGAGALLGSILIGGIANDLPFSVIYFPLTISLTIFIIAFE